MPEDKVIPLTHWIHGQLRIHFRNGHIAELDMSLHAAESLRKQIDDNQGAESIHGLHAHEGWVSAKGEEVVMTEWEPASDYGWPSATADERAAMKVVGIRRGVIHALATLWADRGRHDAGYSATAVATLHSLATVGDITRDQWDRLAVMAEGDEGVRLLADQAPEASGKARDRACNRSQHPERTPAPAGPASTCGVQADTLSGEGMEPSLSSEQVQAHTADDSAPDSAPVQSDETAERGGTPDDRRSHGNDGAIP